MMRATDPNPRRGTRGFGLIELMAALVVTGLVMTAIISVFVRSVGYSQRMSKTVESRQQARLALQLLERDIRMAGSGWGRDRVDGSFNGTSRAFWGILPGFATGDDDSLNLMGAWSAATTLRSAMTDPSSTIECASTAGFATGDLCVVTNGASAHLFQVTGVTSSPADLAHASSSPYNQGGLLGWPPGGYGAGAQVLRVDQVSYRVDSTSYRRPCLVRHESGRSPQVAAWDVERFTVNYLLQNGTVTRQPDTVTVVSRVIPTILSRIEGTRLDSAKAEIRPRAF
jgi:type IV pilus assembly protein PilW